MTQPDNTSQPTATLAGTTAPSSPVTGASAVPGTAAPASAGRSKKYAVGELRPSQLLFTYGVGSIIDLPYISAMVMGLEDWDNAYASEISENRLLKAVQQTLDYPVQRLLTPPMVGESDESAAAIADERALVGAPVAVFPRWLLCPACRYLGPLSSGLFRLRYEPRRPDKAQYVHESCNRNRGNRIPAAVPARFLVACEAGHIDDFPWDYFVHAGASGCNGPFQLKESGPSGEAANIQLVCLGCKKTRRMSEAFGPEGRKNLPPQCSGRRVHLRDYADSDCALPMRSISLGASNSWFPVILSALAVPVSTTVKLDQIIEEYWAILDKAATIEIVRAFRAINQLPALATYSDEEIWQATERRRATLAASVSGQGQSQAGESPTELKLPEWKILSTARHKRGTELENRLYSTQFLI